jgi:hypothetical protein
MRLSKDICLICWKNQFPKTKEKERIDSIIGGNWEKGYTYCPSEIAQKPSKRSIKSCIPKWCPFTLEHTVSQ